MAAMHAVAPALLLLNTTFAFLKLSIREKLTNKLNQFNSIQFIHIYPAAVTGFAGVAVQFSVGE
jgi:hypothetical protein